MSEENVETVQRHIEAWNRRDLTTWLATFRSDADIDWSRSRGPLKGVYRGDGEHAAFWGEFWSTFESVQLETYDIREVGSEVVVSEHRPPAGAPGSRSDSEEHTSVHG